MDINKSLKTLAFATLIASSSQAQAALIYGAEAYSSVATCPSYCSTFNFSATYGGEGSTSTGTSSVSDYRGNSKASASLSGAYATPVLKAASSANAGGKFGAFGTTFAVQGYTYNGPGETLSLDISLTGLVDDPVMDLTDTYARLEVVIYEVDPFYFIGDRPTLEYEVMATPWLTTDGQSAESRLQLDYTNTQQALDNISFDVAAGDQFYIWAYLRTSSKSVSELATSADAFNTAVMSFANNPNLTPASVVPVPAALWLFGSGLLGLVGIARRRAHGQA